MAGFAAVAAPAAIPTAHIIPMRRAYSYKRFSSPKQAAGDSLRRQTEFEQEIVGEMNLHLDDSVDLTDRAVSGFRGDNSKFGALSEFLKLVESGRVPAGSVLLVEALDRISRENVLDAFNLFSRIICAGVTIVTATPKDVYSRETVAADMTKLMVPLVYFMRGHDESARKSVRVGKAWAQRRKRAVETGEPLTARCPAWLRVVGGKYEVIEERAAAVRRVYELAADGLGIRRVCRAMVAEGWEPLGRTGRWNEQYVRKLLGWPAVCGEMQPHVYVDGEKKPRGKPVAGYFPAVVDRETFELVRTATAGRRGKSGRPPRGDGNLFTGIVYHAADRCRMAAQRSGGKAARYTYLISLDTKRGKGAGGDDGIGRTFPYPAFEDAVLDALTEIRPGELADRGKGAAPSIDKAITKKTKEVAVLGHRLEESEQMFADPTCTVDTRQLAGAVAKAKLALAAASDELARLQGEAKNCRAETLGEVLALVPLMRKTPAGPERERLRERLKVRIKWLVESVWLLIEVQNKYRRICHFQVFLRSGVRKDGQTASVHAPAGKPQPEPVPRLRLRGVDLRNYRAETKRGTASSPDEV